MKLESPCIDVCALDETGNSCLGCFRTLSEITSWSKMTQVEKSTVMSAIEDRKKQLNLRWST